MDTDGPRADAMSERAMSDKFDRLDAIEKAATEAALNRCRAFAHKIEGKLRNGEHPVDKVSLADLYASLERAAKVLEQKRRRPVHKSRR
jgi:hypothetical protein